MSNKKDRKRRKAIRIMKKRWEEERKAKEEKDND